MEFEILLSQFISDLFFGYTKFIIFSNSESVKRVMAFYASFFAFVRKPSFYATTDILVFRFAYFKGTYTRVWRILLAVQVHAFAHYSFGRIYLAKLKIVFYCHLQEIRFWNMII